MLGAFIKVAGVIFGVALTILGIRRLIRWILRRRKKEEIRANAVPESYFLQNRAWERELEKWDERDRVEKEESINREKENRVRDREYL